jgi:hypothetical protein
LLHAITPKQINNTTPAFFIFLFRYNGLIPQMKKGNPNFKNIF